MWRCPHCGALQAETARCWVCRRSSTTCSTCRHFRSSLAADVGYCALDRRRLPLTGLELRGCWQGAAVHPEAASAAAPEPVRLREAATPAPRSFVPVEDLARPRPRRTGTAAAPSPKPLPVDASERWAERTSLFGDIDL